MKIKTPRYILAILFAIIIAIGCELSQGAIKTAAASAYTYRIFLPLISSERSVEPLSSFAEWTQDAHDWQRTGYISEEPVGPWNLMWVWNGSDPNGGTGDHFYNAPRDARTITGGENVYVPAGNNGLYALGKGDGQPNWHLSGTNFNATPAYDPGSGYLYAGGGNGVFYQIDGSSGSVVRTYNAGSPINRAIMLVNGYGYVVTENGRLHKVNLNNMTRVWVYDAGAGATTPPAYSASRDVIIFCTDDLYVHAVRGTDGARKWRTKPTVHQAEYPYTFDGYWPVIAEQHGIVLVRLNLGMGGLWTGPGSGNIYPSSNAQTRSHLINNPELKNLFALNLENGSEAFVPAVGFGGVETLTQAGVSDLQVGTVPVIRVYPDGTEVAYQVFRSGQGNPPDGRWDSHMGEMVLDANTIPGLVAGDLRFVQFENSYSYITDEQTPLSMAGNTLFYAHWGASESVEIIDRSSNKGLTHENPITSNPHYTVIRRMISCSSYNPTSHYTSCGLGLVNDGKYWNGPGFWVYWNVLDPPTPYSGAYSDGILPRYTYVSDGLVIVEGNGGDLMVFQHSGSH